MSEVMNVLGDECRGDECRTILFNRSLSSETKDNILPLSRKTIIGKDLLI